MRMIFGLVGILGTLVAVVWILHSAYLPYSKAAIDAGNKAKSEIHQMGGVGDDGMRIQDSIALEPAINASGRFRSLTVKSIIATGPMATYFGLKANDAIVKVNDSRIDELSMGDAETAKTLVFQAYQVKWSIEITRDGKSIVLPAGK